MKKKFIVFRDYDGDVSEPRESSDHKIGDVITRYSYDNQYKCIDIKEDDEEIIYYFKQGKKIFTFDW